MTRLFEILAWKVLGADNNKVIKDLDSGKAN